MADYSFFLEIRQQVEGLCILKLSFSLFISHVNEQINHLHKHSQLIQYMCKLRIE